MRIIKFIKREVINWLIILLPLIYILLVYDKMPHFGLFKGTREQYIYQNLLFIMGVSIFSYIGSLVNQFYLSKTEFPDSLKRFHRMRTLILAFFSLLSLILISQKIGVHFNLTKAIFLSVMIYMVVIGNLYPTIRYNYFLGIKNLWTLSNEVIWVKTHRFAGRIYFWGGLIGALFVILFKVNQGPFMPLILMGYIIILNCLPIIFSHRLYQKLPDSNIVNYPRKVKLIRLMWLSSSIVIVGAIFKIQHWPGSQILMFTGLLIGLILLVVYYKSTNTN
jgi:uncharacterized membrane protein